MSISFDLTDEGRKELAKALVQAIKEDDELLNLLRSLLEGTYKPPQVEGYSYPTDEMLKAPGALSRFYQDLGFTRAQANILGKRNLTPHKLLQMTDREILDEYQVGPALLMEWHSRKENLRSKK
ncbi:MAG: hypothetical protein QG639_195 [Patescibacteria group bacterium]|jgi:DNA-directed RNA polymerase subunit L|nr:hypothetical protein [Patescibacteria group bacterium]